MNMPEITASDIEAIVRGVLARLGLGPAAGPVPGSPEAPRIVLAAGQFADGEIVDAAACGFSGVVVFDPRGRTYRPDATVVTTPLEAIRAASAGGIRLVGLSLRELETLASWAAGAGSVALSGPDAALADALSEALGLGLPVSVDAGIRRAGARLTALPAPLARRRDAALAALGALGVSLAPGAPGPGTSGSPAAASPGAPFPSDAPRLVDSALIRSVPPGSSIRLSRSSIVTPLARDEARERGIVLDRGAAT